MDACWSGRSPRVGNPRLAALNAQPAIGLLDLCATRTRGMRLASSGYDCSEVLPLVRPRTITAALSIAQAADVLIDNRCGLAGPTAARKTT